MWRWAAWAVCAVLPLGCAGAVAVPQGPSPEAQASDAARAAIIHAVARGGEASAIATDLLAQRRRDQAAGLSESVVAVLTSLRVAVPSTRSIDPAGLEATAEVLAIADRYYDALERDPQWRSGARRSLVLAAGEVLDAADAMVSLCGERACANADVVYGEVFARYEGFRTAAAALAERATVPGYWLAAEGAVDDGLDDSAAWSAAVARACAERGRALRALARRGGADACVEALDVLPLDGPLPEPCAALLDPNDDVVAQHAR